MEACIAEIKSWIGANFHKLNDEKTEPIMFGSQHDLRSISECTVSVGNEVEVSSKNKRNIGAMLNSALSMKPISSYITRKPQNRQIRKYLEISKSWKIGKL